MENFATYFVVIYVFMLSPGPSMALISRNSARYSIAPTMYTIYGVLASITVYSILAIVGVAALIETHPQALKVAKFIGSLYIGYIGIKILLNAKNASLETGKKSKDIPSKPSMFLTGFTTDFSNPMTVVGLTSVIVSFVYPSDPMLSKLVYLILTVVAGFLYALTYAFLFGNSLSRGFLVPRLVLFERVAGSAVIFIALLFLYKVLLG